jgi:hypothetical protein
MKTKLIKPSDPPDAVIKKWRIESAAEYQNFVKGVADLLSYAMRNVAQYEHPNDDLTPCLTVMDAIGELLFEIGGLPLMTDVTNITNDSPEAIWDDVLREKTDEDGFRLAVRLHLVTMNDPDCVQRSIKHATAQGRARIEALKEGWAYDGVCKQG